jgi:hypothetical protein
MSGNAIDDDARSAVDPEEGGVTGPRRVNCRSVVETLDIEARENIGE